jgi:hypothetical protein
LGAGLETPLQEWGIKKERNYFRSSLLFHGPVHASFVFLFLECLPLVVGFLSFSQSYFQFGQPFFVYKQLGGDNGVACFLRSADQLVQFPFGQQQFPVAANIVVVVSPKKVSGYMHVPYPQFIVDKCAIGIAQAGFTVPDRFYFGAV